MSSEPGTIRANDRVFICGKTGSGKTHLAKKLIWSEFSNVIFFDVKNTNSDLDAPTLHSLDDVKEALNNNVTRIRYVPDALSDDKLKEFDEMCKIIWQYGRMHLIVDEMKAIYQKGNTTRSITDYHEALLTRGREKKVGVTGLTQRPHKVPLESMSESEHFFIFKLNIDDDRKRVTKITGGDREKLRTVGQHEFYYYHTRLDSPTHNTPI